MKCDNCGKAFNQIRWCDECRQAKPPVVGSATGSTSSDKKSSELQDVLVYTSLTEEEHHWTTIHHVRAVLRVLKSKGVIR